MISTAFWCYGHSLATLILMESLFLWHGHYTAMPVLKPFPCSCICMIPWLCWCYCIKIICYCIKIINSDSMVLSLLWRCGHADSITILMLWSFWGYHCSDISVIMVRQLFWCYGHSGDNSILMALSLSYHGYCDVIVAMVLSLFWGYGHSDVITILMIWSFWCYHCIDTMVIMLPLLLWCYCYSVFSVIMMLLFRWHRHYDTQYHAYYDAIVILQCYHYSDGIVITVPWVFRCYSHEGALTILRMWWF